MSRITLRRTFFTLALLLSAQALLAANPSARTGARMAFDESTGLSVMFGGEAVPDSGTATTYNPSDTWTWDGTRWVQRYPLNHPPGRSNHVMVFDSARSRELIFGGRTGTTDLNDTWVFDNNDWTKIVTSNSPSERALAGAAYDRVRDRVVLFGGNHTVVATNGAQTVTNYYDTWEFDGTNWKLADLNGPNVVRPILVYDEAHETMLMIGEDVNFKPLMYSYDVPTHTWNPITPATMPECVNQAGAVYQRPTSNVILIGGVCVTATFTSSMRSWRS